MKARSLRFSRKSNLLPRYATLLTVYSEKEQAQDKKDMEQLYKDIMNGGLRKRRGGDAFDVSDDEDEAEQLRRRKQMQFRQMTKALIADENIGKLAGNPKQAAFFRSLQDMEDDPDYDFLDAPMEAGLDISPSQEEGQDDGDDTAGIVPDSQAVDTLTTLINPLKRKATDSQEKENRPPPHLRRTAATDSMMRKPMTIADVQHSVAELLEDPRIMVPDSQGVDSDSELEIEPPTKPTSRKPIIDRLSLSRNASISSAPTTANMAFHGPSAGGNQPGFRVPSLVRKATSNMSAMSTSSTGVSTAVEGSSVRRGGTGRSNIHAQAREAERRAAVEKVEKKRKETLKKKVAQAKGQRSVLKCLDGGFE
jgi:mediator of replication checkpoint protein 1